MTCPLPIINNIILLYGIAQLEKRRLHNNRFDRYMDSGYRGLQDYAYKNCQINHAVQLDTKLTQASEITCMTFDSEGVLLAVSDNKGYVRIFDFDEANAADIKMKRRRLQSQKEDSVTVEPFIVFRTGDDRISSVTWNPFHQNLLGITFFNKDEVRIYDVSTCSNRNGPLYTSLLCNQYSRNNGVLTLSFVSLNKVLTGGNEGSLNHWMFTPPSRNKIQSRAIWTVNPWNFKNGQCGGITEIVQCSSNRCNHKYNFVIVATTMGYFAVIDMNQCSVKSFSSKATPAVLKTWNLSQLSGLRKHVLPSGTWMGVKKIYIWAEKTQETNISSARTTVLIDLAVITNGGWVIVLKFDITNNDSSCASPKARVLYRTPKVIQSNSSQTLFYEGPNSRASVPKFASVCGKLDPAASWIVVTKTHPSFEILPDSDKRVLSHSVSSGGLISSATKKNDEIDGLSVIHRNWGEQFTIPIEGKLKLISIHPGNEWIVAYLVTPSGQQSVKLMSFRNRNASKRLKSTLTKTLDTPKSDG